MKILYLSDKYTYNIMGTKRSIAEEVARVGHNVLFIMLNVTSNPPLFLKEIADFGPDQIWFAHSALTIPQNLKEQIKVPVIGFGFSDPYYFSPARLKSYDAYITNHAGTLEKYQHLLPMHYNATACDFKFHKNLSLDPIYDASLIGLANHPRFHNSTERLSFVNLLRKDAPDLSIAAFGNGWPKHRLNFGHIDGNAFLHTINLSCLGLDIQDDWSPLAHRMFEYSACQVPVITRRRDEVFSFFEEDKEILAYDSYEEFRNKVKFYCSKPEKLRKIGVAAENRCRSDHDIRFRVQKLLAFINTCF